MPTASTLQGPAPVIWLLTDNKPGHRNQLKGLGNRLRVLTGASLHWVETDTLKVPMWRAMVGAAPALPQSLPAPNLVIAAGAGTHRLLLALRRLKRSRTVVLMKPGFPLSLVDAAIVPEHDNIKASNRTLLTQGVINSITPMARLTDKPEALLLIGGPSRHFAWDNTAVFNQVLQLMANYPEWRWTLSDSRRTPAELVARLRALEGPKVTVVGHQQTHENWLPHQLAASRAVWVTPDSNSMVFEAITSGVPTGILDLPPSHHSRLAKALPTLAELGYLGLWLDQNNVMNRNRHQGHGLWEADRAARWLIDTLMAGRQA